MDNNKLDHYKGNELLVSRIEDWINQAKRYHDSIVTPFLNEKEVAIVKKICGNRINFTLDGGYSNAQMAKVVFSVDDEPVQSDVVCLMATYNERFIKLTHRDVLGALMNLNIQRNQFGDLWVDGNKIVLYTSKNLVNFIMNNCTRISKCDIQFEISSNNLVQVINKKAFTAIISSQRLDNVVSALAGVSRTQAQVLIRAQKVSINHEILVETSKLCNNDDTISIRGVGRFVYLGILKNTKKERILVEFEQYV